MAGGEGHFDEKERVYEVGCYKEQRMEKMMTG